MSILEAKELARRGAAAAEAAEALEFALRADEDAGVRAAAALALRRVDPTAAARAAEAVRADTPIRDAAEQGFLSRQVL